MHSTNMFSLLQNDCALTTDSDGHLYLLETIPGRQYRAKKNSQGHMAALLYFRNIVEDHAQQRDSEAHIKAILKADYSPEYQNMLRYLQPEHFVQVDPKPFASGANGAVYGAVWRPVTGLCSMQPEEPEVAVVLKQIRSDFTVTESLRKIIHEVRSFQNYSLLSSQEQYH